MEGVSEARVDDGSDKVVGYLDTIGGPEIVGWVYDRDRPEESLKVAIKIDGRIELSTSANVYRPDVICEGHRRPNVGFHVLVPARFHDGSEHAVEFTDGGGSRLVLRDSRSGQPSQSWRVSFGRARQQVSSGDDSHRTTSIVAHIDEVNEQGVSGWAYDDATLLEPARLVLCIDGEHAGEFVCDGPRLDVQSSGHPRLHVGFLQSIPLRYFDSAPHKVQLRDIQGHLVRAVTRSDLQMAFMFDAISVRGRVDGLQDGALRGWAVQFDRDTGRTRGGLQVLVTMQGHPIVQMVARASRADVAKAHDCDPNCGFAFYPPVKLVAGRTVEFDFRVIPGGHVLSGSPVRVQFPSLETAAAIRDLQEATDKAFAELWILRDRIRRLATSETCTVDNYDPWARQYQEALAAAPDRLKGLLPAKDPPPLVSIICPTYRPRLADFKAAIESVRNQTYPRWELIIVDDASRSAQLSKCIATLAQQDDRIKAVSLKGNRGISAATNASLARAKGRYVAFLDHDDLLEPRAIEFMLAAALRSGALMLYSDEDKIDDDGLFSEPNFKPDWNYRLLLSQNYICHLLLVDREILRKAGPFRSECDGAQDHDVVLRLSEAIPHHKIEHVPEVLYHWRKTPASTSVSVGSKTYTVAAGVRAVQDHLDRKGLAGRVHAPRGITCFEIDWRLSREPAVTVIIPYREHVTMTRACLQALGSHTDYTNYRIVLVDNWSVSDEALMFAAEMNDHAGVSVLRVEEPFNYSRLNNLGRVDGIPDMRF